VTSAVLGLKNRNFGCYFVGNDATWTRAKEVQAYGHRIVDYKKNKIRVSEFN
jgi:hypothetical protein